jgi:ATP-dependent RNA helicase RhlE
VTQLSFSELGVSEPLCRALAAENYTTPTPIQTRAIPLLLEGRDLLGIAQTGTGKTAAFALPILQKLSKPQQPVLPRATHALILAPTRELAV